MAVTWNLLGTCLAGQGIIWEKEVVTGCVRLSNSWNCRKWAHVVYV